MRGLGRLCLAGVLLGAPRAVRAVLSVLRPRTVCLEVAESDGAVVGFVSELKRAIDRRALNLALGPIGPPVVAEVHRLARHRVGGSQQTTVIVTVSHEGKTRPLLLHGADFHPRAAARTLVSFLERRLET
jgi:hypothetical protein